MIDTDGEIHASDLAGGIEYMWELSAAKIRSIEASHEPTAGAPVVTVGGKYTSRAWTEWTQGFQYGSAILQFDATGDAEFLELGREATARRMAAHVTHFGVHDHGFNNISTYGNLLRLICEGRIDGDLWQRRFCELALKCSGAVQARRWTSLADGGGYIYSFNGPHSLFVDTIRSCRALAVAHMLGQEYHGENDVRVSLLERVVKHCRSTARYNISYGQGRDAYDVRGRTTHECIFNVNDGNFRCLSSQQGYSPFSTWTRGLAWAMCGFAEQLEFLASQQDDQLALLGGRADIEKTYLDAAAATCDFYIENASPDGLVYWDTGAPQLEKLGDWRSRPADPYNEFEPVDSSAAAIAAQGLLRLGHYLKSTGRVEQGRRYWQGGLVTLKTLLGEPYLSVDGYHQGLLLHSVYHRPAGWDHIPPGCKIPCGESSMWGDYHLREAALYLQRIIDDGPYLNFWPA